MSSASSPRYATTDRSAHRRRVRPTEGEAAHLSGIGLVVVLCNLFLLFTCFSADGQARSARMGVNDRACGEPAPPDWFTAVHGLSYPRLGSGGRSCRTRTLRRRSRSERVTRCVHDGCPTGSAPAAGRASR
jgi:hypothetical protein